MKKLTKAQKKDYIEHGGLYCPCCKSDNVNAGQIYADGACAWAGNECFECGKKWQDEWKLVGVNEN